MDLFGLNVHVIEDQYLDCIHIQFRFPKSKRKRIVRKWVKNPKNWKTGCIKMGNSILISRSDYDKLKDVCYDVIHHNNSKLYDLVNNWNFKSFPDTTKAYEANIKYVLEDIELCERHLNACVNRPPVVNNHNHIDRYKTETGLGSINGIQYLSVTGV